MAKPNTKCRVCGKEYFCCADHQKLGGWKTMACCEEHYKEYMRRILESRKPIVVEKSVEVIEDVNTKGLVETSKKRAVKMKPQLHVFDEVEKEVTEENSSEE